MYTSTVAASVLLRVCAGNVWHQVSDIPAAVTDTEPPIIQLIGAADQEVVQMTEYVDPGAVADDSVDGYVRVSTQGAVSIDTKILGEYVVLYQAKDAAGNFAEGQRTVRVVSPCEPPSFMCLDLGICATCAYGDNTSVSCVCMESLDQGSDEIVVQSYKPVPDYTAPVLVLNGDAPTMVTPSGTLVMIREVR